MYFSFWSDSLYFFIHLYFVCFGSCKKIWTITHIYIYMHMYKHMSMHSWNKTPKADLEVWIIYMPYAPLLPMSPKQCRLYRPFSILIITHLSTCSWCVCNVFHSLFIWIFSWKSHLLHEVSSNTPIPVSFFLWNPALTIIT